MYRNLQARDREKELLRQRKRHTQTCLRVKQKEKKITNKGKEIKSSHAIQSLDTFGVIFEDNILIFVICIRTICICAAYHRKYLQLVFSDRKRQKPSRQR